MAAPFPTALQRTSDERWVTLDVVARENDRALARILEAPAQTAVLRLQRGQPYDHLLRDLLETPPPAPGSGVHMAWPVDLLHDLDASAVGYAAPRPPARRTFPLADFVDPVRRAGIAPLATRRHLLRVARNVATATAALHHAGHGGVRGRQLRLDDRARIVVVRVDELLAHASAVQQADDQRRLGWLVVRLLGGRPWASDGDLADLIRRAGDVAAPAVPAQEWFFALREAERALPTTAAVTAPTPQAEESTRTRVVMGTDLATALSRARSARGLPAPTWPPAAEVRPAQRAAPTQVGSGQRRPSTDVRPGRRSPSAEVQPGQRSPSAEVGPGQRSSSAEVRPGQRSPSTATARPGRPARHHPAPARRRRRAAHVDGRHTARGARVRTTPAAAAGPARAIFAVAVGLALGGVASVAPFLVFTTVAVLMVLRAAIDVGRRKATLGPLQTVAITLTRLVPFATGGVALAAFILLDLLLVLGLCMALAEQLFGYGPGFTLQWILDLPEVPGLVRGFAFAVGAFAGLVRGGPAYDRIRDRSGGRRLITSPAIALALAAGILFADAGVLWWPLPLLT